MTVSLTTAINAYVDAVKSANPGAGDAAPAQTPGSGFADLMKSIGEDAIAAGTKADQMSIAAVEGKANVAEVVTAVANAELALQTVVAVRDQVVQAYQEILRMPI
ncbi:MAG: flagellar hook-basal body complex protein FliE [Alphaproteobacteria bacterium]|nr:flagellar hook-basal body complex protein FliE [Alphaproteobacteria bacterium]